MSGVTYDYIEKYIRELIPKSADVLRELEEYAAKNNVPIVQKETRRFLELMITLKKPNSILELGTAIGYSAILMNISSNGISEITTVERDKNMIEIAAKNLEKYGFQDKINILEGDCLEILQNLEGSFDLIFIDAGKGHYNHFFPYCKKLLSNDGVIIADNVLFRGMVASKELLVRRKITIVKRMKSYLELISDDDDFVTSVLPMGDGIAVSVRRS